jgi:hypothetical protein
MYCATSDAAIDLPVFEGTMMSKTWDSRTLIDSQQRTDALGDNVEVGELPDALAQASALPT